MADAGLLRILYVDDDLSFLDVAQQILTLNRQFVVEAVASADKALQALASLSFDVIVADYDMPGRDGLMLLEELRKSGNSIPFILFTGKGREEVAIKALNLGANYYLNKHGTTETVFGELEHAILSVVKAARTERALNKSEQCYKSIFEYSLDGIMMTKPDGTILSANPQACRMLGMTEDEIKKAGREGLVVKDEKLEVALKEREKTGYVRAELTFRRKDGTTFIADVSSAVFKDSPGEIKTILSIRDITERKKAEEALKQSERRFRDFLDSMPEIVFKTNREGKIIYINKAATEITGFATSDALGQDAVEFLAPKDRKRAAQNIQRILQGEESLGNEYQLLKKDGTAFPVMVYSKRVFDEGGNPCLCGIMVDISELKKPIGLWRYLMKN